MIHTCTCNSEQSRTCVYLWVQCPHFSTQVVWWSELCLIEWCKRWENTWQNLNMGLIPIPFPSSCFIWTNNYEMKDCILYSQTTISSNRESFLQCFNSRLWIFQQAIWLKWILYMWCRPTLTIRRYLLLKRFHCQNSSL